LLSFHPPPSSLIVYRFPSPSYLASNNSNPLMFPPSLSTNYETPHYAQYNQASKYKTYTSYTPSNTSTPYLSPYSPTTTSVYPYISSLTPPIHYLHYYHASNKMYYASNSTPSTTHEI